MTWSESRLNRLEERARRRAGVSLSGQDEPILWLPMSNGLWGRLDATGRVVDEQPTRPGWPALGQTVRALTRLLLMKPEHEAEALAALVKCLPPVAHRPDRLDAFDEIREAVSSVAASPLPKGLSEVLEELGGPSAPRPDQAPEGCCVGSRMYELPTDHWGGWCLAAGVWKRLARAEGVQILGGGGELPPAEPTWATDAIEKPGPPPPDPGPLLPQGRDTSDAWGISRKRRQFP